MSGASTRADGRDGILAWLLAGDPAIAWQVKADLAGAGAEVVARERSRVAVEGWGSRLLELQDDDGRWAGTARPTAR